MRRRCAAVAPGTGVVPPRRCRRSVRRGWVAWLSGCAGGTCGGRRRRSTSSRARVKPLRGHVGLCEDCATAQGWRCFDVRAMPSIIAGLDRTALDACADSGVAACSRLHTCTPGVPRGSPGDQRAHTHSSDRVLLRSARARRTPVEIARALRGMCTGLCVASLCRLPARPLVRCVRRPEPDQLVSRVHA